MTRPTHPLQYPDNQLADFTDRVLAGKTSALASASAEQLRELEETVLRLSQAFPERALDEKTIKHLEADFRSRLRKDNSSRPAWQSQQTRQRFGLALAAIVILVAVIILFPFLSTGSGNVQGTAGLGSQSIGLLIGLGCVLILAVWLLRRK